MPPATLTQAEPSPTASPCGVPATSVVLVVASVFGSILVSAPEATFAAQTARSPKAIWVTPKPVGIVCSTGFGPGSIRQTTPFDGSVAQTDPAPTAIPTRLLVGTWTTSSILSVRLSMCPIAGVPRCSVRNQTPASPTATADAEAGTRARRAPVCGSSFEIEPSGPTAQTPPLPAASKVTPVVTSGGRSELELTSFAVLVTSLDCGSTRETFVVAARPSMRLRPLVVLPPTQTAPSPAASSVGWPLTAKVRTTRRVSGSRCVIVRSSAFSTQTPPAPTAMSPGVVPTVV